MAHLLVDSDFRYLQTSASGGSKTSFSGQKWLYFQSCLLRFKDIEHWRAPKDAPCKAAYFTYQALNNLINIGGLNWGNRFAKTGTEPAGSGFSWNRYSRNGPKMKPLLTLDTAAIQTPVSPPRCCNCSHRKHNPGRTFKNGL